ncbi:Carbohydrate esterase family 16 protein [Mycena venus]|uniref:Carbohydrate esterase family 16 protein n=1 Tax=Mycena venus TaxID=2733690 RepID=A0A8H7DBL1_9AGAR|nr:Carbohydrate esterase family 16 protein [Mycena venus]
MTHFPNDVLASSTTSPQTATDLLAQIKQLAAAPTNAKNIVVLDNCRHGAHSPTGDALKQGVFVGLTPLRSQWLNVAFVDFAPLWDAVLGMTPGFAAFGYKTPDACIPTLDQKDLSGECSTPLNSFYWLHSWVIMSGSTK